MTATDEGDSASIRFEGIIGLQEETNSQGDRAVDRLTYRIFISIVSLNALLVMIGIYIIPLPAPAKEVLQIVDVINALIFLGDFFLRIFTRQSKMRYFLREWGWIDLLGSMPFHPLLRLLRILRSFGLWYRLALNTSKAERDEARRRLAESTLFVVASMVLLVVTYGALAISLIEPPARGANIQSGSDAVWYVIVTIATVGYGDRYPVTNPGRIVGVVLIVMGVSAFSVLTSYIATRFLARPRSEV
jgi:voltage-gated potassium channel